MFKKNRRIGTRSLFFLITYGILLYMGLQHFDVIRRVFGYLFAICMPVIIGVCIAFVLNIFLNLFHNKVFGKLENAKKTWIQKMRTPLSVFSTALLFCAILAVIIYLMIPQVSEAINVLIEKMPNSIEQLLDMIDEKLIAMNAPAFISEKLHELDMDWDSLVKFVSNLLDGKVTTVLGTAVNATRSVLSGITTFLLGFIIAIYMLFNKQRVMYLMHKVVELIVPDQYEPQVFRVLRLTRTAFSNFLTGQMIEALVIGTLCTVGLLIFRFPYAVTIGLLTGFTTLLPIIGAWIGGAVGLLLIWVDSPEKAIWFLIFILALQQIDGQFIYPKIVGDSIGLPGLLVLIAVIIGGGFAGIMGIILAVPIFAIGYALLKDAIDNMPPKKTKPVVETPAPEPEESDEENEET